MAQAVGLVVLEGANSSGKSTLAQHLVKEHGAAYIHCKHRFKHQIFTYHQAALRRAQALSQRRLVVIDRLWLSEDIYARVYRKGSPWPHEGRVLDKIWLKNAAIGVLCLIDPTKAVEMAAKRAATYHSPELIMKPGIVAGLYSDVWHGRPGPEECYANDVAMEGGLQLRSDWVRYSIEEEGQDLAEFSRRLLERLKVWRANQYQAALHGSANVAGHLMAATHVMVGDRVNYRDWRRTWPFSSYSNSSAYLAKASSIAGLDETSLLWTNADCPEQHILALTQAKPSLKFIALGTKAAVKLKSNGIQCAELVHPSYARRFMSKQGAAWYGDKLAAAVLQA